MRLKDSNLIDIRGQDSLSEEHCILWLVSSYGLQVVFRLVSCWNVLPKAITELQALRYISAYCNLPLEDVKTFLSFVQVSCPSLFDTLKSPVDLPEVVAPPVVGCRPWPLRDYLPCDVSLHIIVLLAMMVHIHCVEGYSINILGEDCDKTRVISHLSLSPRRAHLPYRRRRICVSSVSTPFKYYRSLRQKRLHLPRIEVQRTAFGM